MNCKGSSLIYSASLLYKLSELERCMKDYIFISSSNTDFDNEVNNIEHIQKQYQIVNLLLQIIEEINVLKILSSYLLKVKVHRIHNGWTGRTTKKFFG